MCSAISSLLLLFCVTSCDDIENKFFLQEEGSAVQTDAQGRTVYTCVMEFDGGLQGFDGVTKSGVVTRAADNWNDGDIIYLVFNSGKEKIDGKAVYSASTGKWVLYYYGQLATTNSSTCVAYYFDGSVSFNDNETILNIPCTTAVYGTTNASYYKSGHNVIVRAALAPLTGRISFTGTNGYNFHLYGFNVYNRYSIMTGTLTSSSLDDNITIDESGETGFYYGFFPVSTSHKLSFTTSDYHYTTTCDDNVLSIASSGTMTAPTRDVHDGWKQFRNDGSFSGGPVETITVNGISFDMIRIKAGSFWMGADEYHDSKNYFVTLTNDYYMGKVEVTQELWEEVIGHNPSGFLGENCPVENVSWYDCQDFINRLNTMTGKSFRLPTEAEWEFAALGGNQSNGYTWSGSNNIDAVAWYYLSTNYANSYRTHPVATKDPNELGLYDMNGNVFEWCQDWYDDYSNSSQIDPKGPNSGSERVIRGGAWGSSAEGCTNVYREHFDPGGRHDCFGLRLCISPFSLCL